MGRQLCQSVIDIVMRLRDIEKIKFIKKCCFQQRLLEQSNFNWEIYQNLIDSVMARKRTYSLSKSMPFDLFIKNIKVTREC